MPSQDSEARLLLLIDGFTTRTRGLQGRTKLAKLDFLLRYPGFLDRALMIRAPHARDAADNLASDNIENRMIRFRYGPWDPAYFALLGSLIGRGLVEPRAGSRGIEYWATSDGVALAERILESAPWHETVGRIQLLKRHFDLTGTSLKEFIYKHFPEVTRRAFGATL